MSRKSLILGGTALVFAIVAIAVFFLVDKSRTEAERAKAGEDIRIDLLGSAPAPSDAVMLGSGAAAPEIEAEPLELAAHPILIVSGAVKVDEIATTKVLGASYDKIKAFMTANGLKQSGPPIAITQSFDQEKRVWRFKAGIPIAVAPATSLPEGITLAQSYSGRAIRFVHLGDPNHAERSYARIEQWMTARGLFASGASWEEYLSDPQTPVETWRTNIYIPIE